VLEILQRIHGELADDATHRLSRLGGAKIRPAHRERDRVIERNREPNKFSVGADHCMASFLETDAALPLAPIPAQFAQIQQVQSCSLAPCGFEFPLPEIEEQRQAE
jgi:hypothetical protein